MRCIRLTTVLAFKIRARLKLFLCQIFSKFISNHLFIYLSPMVVSQDQCSHISDGTMSAGTDIDDAHDEPANVPDGN